MVSDEKLAAAEVLGRTLMKSEPRATQAHYDTVTGRITLELTNGCSYVFPAHLVQDLQDASSADLALIEVDWLGFNLHWPALDVDLYVPALVAGVFGTRSWMTRELARVAGQKTSPAKAAAARSNGSKGGRPPKTAIG